MTTTKEIAWLAGLLEGEAHFGISNRSSPRISVKMTDLDIIQRISHLFDSTVYGPSPNRSGRGKDMYFTYACGNKGVAWMMTIFPFMGERRQQRIRESIAIWKAAPGAAWRGKLTHCKNGHPLSGPNLRLHLNGSRRCRICESAYKRLWRKNKREQKMLAPVSLGAPVILVGPEYLRVEL